MFDSMAIAADDDAWIAAAVDHFRLVLASDDVIGVVVEAPDGRLAASGVIELQQRIPSPWNPAGTSAYISTMSTDVPWRRRGFARAVLERLVAEARHHNVQRVELHATPDAAPLYRSIGFTSRAGGDEMRLDLTALA